MIFNIVLEQAIFNIALSTGDFQYSFSTSDFQYIQWGTDGPPGPQGLPLDQETFGSDVTDGFRVRGDVTEQFRLSTHE